MLESSWVAAQLAASQVVLSSIELVICSEFSNVSNFSCNITRMDNEMKRMWNETVVA
jgi:hypothetical protein